MVISLDRFHQPRLPRARWKLVSQLSDCFTRSARADPHSHNRCVGDDTGVRNAELARRGFQAALQGDLEFIAALLAPDVKWHGGDPDAEGACRNSEQALEFMRRGLSRWGGVELADVIAAGERVVVVIRRPSAGGKAAVSSANLVTFHDGKVVEMVAYADPAQALAAARELSS